MNTELSNLIVKIDALKKSIDSLRPFNKDLENKLLQKIRFEWNFHSNHIEGNTLSYGETKALLLWGVTAEGKPLRDHLEIKGHNLAIEYLMDIIKNNETQLTEAFIREFHKIIIPEDYYLDAITSEGKMTKRKITAGQYKSMPNHVLTPTGETFYFASPEETPAKMMDLMNWYRDEIESKSNHPLIIASMFHYKFVRIHPFDDGNGRMSRLLMNFILMNFGFPPVIINFSLKSDYLNSLQYADSDDYDKFIIFIAERLIESLNLYLKVANNQDFEE